MLLLHMPPLSLVIARGVALATSVVAMLVRLLLLRPFGECRVSLPPCLCAPVVMNLGTAG